ncbi:MAG: DUF4082 domain-containing protein, partial [Acidobacteria bacterium]|nr:DUF4082 domain-containing protein [Acidobacteriota bacterium]
FRPAGLFRLSSNTLPVSSLLLDYGSRFGSGTATHSLTLYKHASGALVFATGTIQWSWALDTTHDDPDSANGPLDPVLKQATVNLFADMGAQPRTLESGLTASTASTDTVPATATISFPAPDSQVPANQVVTIAGTASDTGGVAAGVEVSTDNGVTWHPAAGAASWTYSWTPTALGPVTVRARAVDDSGNLQATPATLALTVVDGDSQPPVVVSMTPPAGASDVLVGAVVTAVFSESMSAATITTATVELRNPSNQVVPATVTYDDPSRRATLTPQSALAFNSAYTVRIRGGSSGVKDSSGISMVSDVTWAFSTTAPPNCPCSLWDLTTAPTAIDTGDTNPYELGVRFRSEVDGYISAIRFYKGAGSSGLKVNLWSGAGALLATAPFLGDASASGWQEVALASPVPVAAQAVYVASYHTPNGRYAFDANFFNGGWLRSPLYAFASSEGNNGVFKSGTSGFPT